MVRFVPLLLLTQPVGCEIARLCPHQCFEYLLSRNVIHPSNIPEYIALKKVTVFEM